MSRAQAELAALESAIAGRVLLPGSAGYDDARATAFAQYADIQPAAIVQCGTSADVAEALARGRRLAFAIAVRSGGHDFAGRSTTRGLVIDVGPFSAVELEGTAATIGAGATLGDVYPRLERDGRAIAAGSCPTVGIAGLALGGGLGILGRTYGLTCDQLLEAQVVLADGRVVECDRHRHDDLFWALRGAGAGQFGVVTRLVFRTVPAQELTCFRIGWPLTAANAVVDAWQAWAPEAPDALAASLLLNAFGDVERPPTVTLFGAMLGAKAETVSLLDEFTGPVGDPVSVSLEQLPYGAAKRYLTENAPGIEGAGEEGPMVVFNKSEFFRSSLPPDGIAALVGHLIADRVRGQARELDFTPWGGAYNDTPAEATAFVHRNERFLLKHAVSLDADASSRDRELARAWLARSWTLAHPYGSGGVFPNFADPELDAWSPAYHGANRDRLMRIKARYDPENVFRFERRPATRC